MTNSAGRPKVLLFDIGGVCVVSPFQAILDYEKANNIPIGWVNFAISRSAPNGAWQRLERGEIKIDDGFFQDFNADLRNPDIWPDYYAASVKKQLGSGASSGSLTDDYSSAAPEIDGKWLFWEMMRISRTPDPWIYGALKKLKASNQFIIGALSNTIIFPPDHPYSQQSADDVRSMFDVFVSSAHVGLRKPDPRIYRLAVSELDRFAQTLASGGRDDAQRGSQSGIRAGDILFLDDIGENLKAAKKAGIRTLKVNLGKGDDAVRELERISGLSLMEPIGDVGSKSKL
ncbi:MAG: hypothetical protein M4579_005306 [Chaenotheca gracillima]|nr:MAG: hypothetical protein M4579_005306 [Chaenotheca gracillima]